MIRSRTRVSVFLRLAVLLLAAAAPAVVAGCGSSTSKPAPTRVGLESIFEDELGVRSDPAGALAMYRRLGVARMRVYVPWGSVAPDPTSPKSPPGFRATDPAAYTPAAWAIYDTIIRDAANDGIGIDLTLGAPPPLWAEGRGAPQPRVHTQWRPSPRAFGSFVRAVATRYSGTYRPAGSPAPLPRVSFWAIWNEPNYGPELAPQAIDSSTVEVSPRLYRGLLDAAWEALQGTGHGRDTVLIGELAPRGITISSAFPGNFSGMVPLRFVRALYCVDDAFRPLRGAAAAARGCPTDAARSARFAVDHPALFDATGFADHPYAQGGLQPNVVTLYEPDYADLATLPNLVHTLDSAQAAYGSSKRFPIFSTEFGYQTNPPENIARTTPPATAAIYLNWAEYISWRDPRIRSYDQYLLKDPPAGNFATGLLFANGTPKPTFAAFRLPIYLPVTAAASGHALEVWGCVRPFHYARLVPGGGSQSVNIQFAASGSSAFRTVETLPLTDPYGYFDVRTHFPGSGSVRLEWSYPQGPAIYSRIVAVTLH